MASVSTEGDSAVLPQFAEPKNPSNTNNGEHNANSNVFISGGFGKIGPKSFSEDILCASCSEAHFESSILPNDRYMVVVATSTVGAILSNKKCSSCRLIFHCMKSLRRVKSISLESQISLFAAPEFFHPRTGRHGKYIKKSLPKRVEIRLHTKKPEDEEGIDIKDHDIIGFLLPVMTEEISNSIGLTNHKALFNTLEYRGSVYARSVASTVNTELLRAWMDFCIASHGSCRITKAPNDANTEVRLIDVVERRLIDATLVEEYVAFSYVWGPGNNKVLMENTLKHFQEKGSLTPSTVPRLVADVMDFVAEIGERYLWIDTACIIQDDPLDKQRQLPNMSSIYTHAKLTIVAAVEGANDPLPRLNGYHYKAPVPIELIQGLPYTIGEPPLVAALERTTWNSRGWTFQEALLARRLLVFTEDLTYWSCREESWCEDQYTEFHDLKNVPTPQSSLLAIDSRRSNCNRKASAVFRLSSMELYAKHAQTYSRRSFSNYSDIVWAFLGILKDMKEGFPNGYVWALPHDRLDSALLWLACCERTQCLEHQYGTSHQSRLMIPSWCWIGKGHNIWFMNGLDNIISRVTWHEPVKCWSSEIDSVDDDQELTHSSQASALSDTQSTRENSVAFDYAFLHFTAQTAMLTIELGSDRSNLVIFNTYNGNELADSTLR